MVRLAEHAAHFVEDLIKTHGIDCDFEPTGNVFAAVSRGLMWQSTVPRSSEIDRNAWRIRDTKAACAIVERTHTGRAYSEAPPSQTMRLVGSVEGCPRPRPTWSRPAALLLYRQRRIDVHFDLIPCRRNDRIRLTAAGPRLLSREVILTETSLKTANLGVFL